MGQIILILLSAYTSKSLCLFPGFSSTCTLELATVCVPRSKNTQVMKEALSGTCVFLNALKVQTHL